MYNYGVKTSEERKAYLKQYYLDHKDVIKQRSSAAYEKDKEPFLTRSKQQKERLGDAYSQYQRDYRAKNKDRLNAYTLKRLHTEPVFKLKHTLRGRFRKLVKGEHKTNSVLTLLGCSVEKLKEHIESQWLAGMTWENWGKLWHIDHIVPCVSFDLTKYSDQLKCWHYTNLRPLFALDNLRKGGKIF